MPHCLFVLLALLVSGGAVAQEARVERIDVVGKGLYKVETGQRTPDTDVPTGSVTLPLKVTKIEGTSSVPARSGVEFGVEYKIIGEPTGAEVTLEFINKYPADGLADPASPAPLRESRFERKKTIGTVEYFGYGFENDWELVPGVWTFDIIHDGRLLLEEQFTVVE
jgi:Domain of unknown function (DUF3859)